MLDNGRLNLILLGAELLASGLQAQVEYHDDNVDDDTVEYDDDNKLDDEDDDGQQFALETQRQ